MTTTHPPQNEPRPPKHLLLADGHVGLEIARYLASNFKSDLCGIVAMSRNEVFELAERNSVPAFLYDKSESFLRSLPADIDLGILAWWPALVKPPLLDIPARGFVNTHPSLLPHNRGKHPNFWAIVEERPFGVSLHKIDAGVDTGPILAQRAIDYDWTDTGGSLYKKALQATIELFRETYPRIRLDMKTSMQGPGGSFHTAKELDPASEIHLDEPYRARDLLNLLRARTFDGHPSCYFTDESGTFEVRVSISRKG